VITYEINPGRTALLIIDMQNCFVENSPVAAPDGERVLGRLNRLADAARSAGVQVIFTQHVVRADHSNVGLLGEVIPPVAAGVIDDGSRSAAFHDGLRRDPDDIVLKKPRFGSFHGTDLEVILRSRGIDTLIIGGIATNVCVDTTAREAAVREFRVLFLADGTATFDHPDAGLGPASAEEIQRVTCAIIGFAFGEVLTVDDALGRLAAVEAPVPAQS
jgi:nicotinamidase-related amidase